MFFIILLCTITIPYVIQSWYNYIVTLPYRYLHLIMCTYYRIALLFLFGWVHFPFGFVEKTVEGCFSFYNSFDSYTFHWYTFHLFTLIHSYTFFVYFSLVYFFFPFYTFFIRIFFFICILFIRILFTCVLFIRILSSLVYFLFVYSFVYFFHSFTSETDLGLVKLVMMTNIFFNNQQHEIRIKQFICVQIKSSVLSNS